MILFILNCLVIQTTGIRWNEIINDTDELSEQCIQTNYYGSKRMVEALIPLLQSSGSPKIANVSSFMGKLEVENIPNELLSQFSFTGGFFKYVEKSLNMSNFRI